MESQTCTQEIIVAKIPGTPPEMGRIAIGLHLPLGKVKNKFQRKSDMKNNSIVRPKGMKSGVTEYEVGQEEIS